MSEDFRIDFLNDILDDLYENDYTALKLPLGILSYDGIQSHPILSIAFSIYKTVSEGGDYLIPSEIPDPIAKDEYFIPIPSFYLVNDDHIHVQVYMLNNNRWYKVDIHEA